MPEPTDQPPTRGAKAREEWHRTARWKRTLVALSFAVMLVGAVLTAYGKFIAPPPPAPSGNQSPTPGSAAPAAASSSSSSTSSTPTRGFIDSRSAPRSTTPQTQTDPAPTPGASTPTPADEPPFTNLQTFSPALFKLGFSFFAGFCMAFALRTFLKMAAFAIGVILLAAFALQYFGFANINWHLIGGHYDSAAQWLSSQFSSFQSFITGQLPSAASALTGAALGFKR